MKSFRSFHSSVVVHAGHMESLAEEGRVPVGGIHVLERRGAAVSLPPPHPRNQAPSAELTPPPSPPPPPPLFPSAPSTPAASTPPSRAAPPPPPPTGSPTCARLDSSTRADTTVRVDRRHSRRSTPPIVGGTTAVIVTSTNRFVWSGWWPSLTSVRALDGLSWVGSWWTVGLRPTEAPTLTTLPTPVSTASTTDLGGRLGGAKVIGW